MFERDYFMKLIVQLIDGMRRSLFHEYPTPDEEIRDLEQTVGNAVDMDPNLLFNLQPTSLVSMLQLGTFNPEIGAYVVRSIYQIANTMDSHGQHEKAALRREQAAAIANAYHIDCDPADVSEEALKEFLAAQEEQEEDTAETNEAPAV